MITIITSNARWCIGKESRDWLVMQNKPSNSLASLEKKQEPNSNECSLQGMSRCYVYRSCYVWMFLSNMSFLVYEENVYLCDRMVFFLYFVFFPRLNMWRDKAMTRWCHHRWWWEYHGSRIVKSGWHEKCRLRRDTVSCFQCQEWILCDSWIIIENVDNVW